MRPECRWKGFQRERSDGVNGLEGIVKNVVNLALRDVVMDAIFMKMWHLTDNSSTLRSSKWILLMESTKMDG